jgi:hypothetical protein
MCDCKEPVAPNSALDFMTRGVAKRFAMYCSDSVCSQSEAMARLEALSRGTLTRANSRVVAARVPLETAQRIARFAAAHRVAPHVFVRQALALMTAGPVASPDPEGILADLTKALGLPEYTAPGDVLTALRDLFAALGAPAGDALAATPDPIPAELSRADLAAMTPADRGRHHIEAGAARRARPSKPLASNLATRKR